jgi:putative iron-only hydrogenase system regulator
MESRVALIGIVVEDFSSVEKLNSILHEYGNYIIGRMGIPYHKRDISIISVALDAPADVINTISGKLGSLSGVNAKTIYSKLTEKEG